jgi:hypothetical protein
VIQFGLLSSYQRFEKLFARFAGQGIGAFRNTGLAGNIVDGGNVVKVYELLNQLSITCVFNAYIHSQVRPHFIVDDSCGGKCQVSAFRCMELLASFMRK